MNKKERRRLTKEVGLEASYRFFRFATGSEYLHYGRFDPDIPPDFQHLKLAQERYVERLIEIIPPSVRSILDVGAGSGKTAEVLLERGFQVDCVSPGRVLGDLIEDRLQGRGRLYRSRFEDVSISSQYDLVLFSESFQYIPMEVAIEKARALLSEGGHVLICDFFTTDPLTNRIGGGHELGLWQSYLRDAPFDVIVEQDITRETSPVVDILERFNREVFKPVSESAELAALARWPILSRIARFVFRRDLEKLKRKKFSGLITGAEFERTKAYMIYLLRARPS